MSTRDRILDAAAHVMRTRGLANATTKEIARAAGYSEATLYKHFRDKAELFIDVLKERLPSLIPLVKSLAERAGQGTVRDTLLELTRAATLFYHEGFPMTVSIFAEPHLLAAQRTAMGRRAAGPHRANEGVAGYLRAEQKLGRVAADVDPDAAAAMLLGACFQYAFLGHFADRTAEPATVDAFATSIVDTLMRALS
ncbi:MAG: TetR family transcriptional regulator [Actinobacteria bacterium 13_2_20CM_2_71_6]|nr:MAG: TetR family transcriptional regulator [Actinobacteria bacterium 13_2_20CM_2_71_6]